MPHKSYLSFPVRHLIDIWSVPHFLFGTVISLFALVVGIPLGPTLLITFLLALLWEKAERHAHLREYHWNILSDVLLPLLACLFTFFCIGYVARTAEDVVSIFVLSILVYAGVLYVAWDSRIHHDTGFLS